ncbi:amidohydrolase family protein [Streptomyces mutabilis]|uniref:amidohydrolase family protein n=1 Tax=Streptomyces mutabilis TaxID=67332 RepID=UPI0008FB8885|nr:amidohydrolase family protein [Streptomyces mutabilis]
MSGTLDRHRGLTVIVPHCGGALPVLTDRIDGFMEMFMPLGTEAPPPSQLGRLYYALAGPALLRQLPALLRLVGADRLLYGSDHCWTPAASVEAHVASPDTAPAPDEAGGRRALTTANAHRILPARPAERRTAAKTSRASAGTSRPSHSALPHPGRTSRRGGAPAGAGRARGAGARQPSDSFAAAWRVTRSGEDGVAEPAEAGPGTPSPTVLTFAPGTCGSVSRQ